MVRPHTLREDLRRAREFLPPKPLRPKFPLPHDFIAARVPRDILTHIASFLPTTADIAHLDQCCHTFHSHCHGESSIIEDALHARAAAVGHVLTSGAHSTVLLREEQLRVLSASMVTLHEGWPLELSVETNTGYFGVHFVVWRKPWGYRAELDNVVLGWHITAKDAAVAIAKRRSGALRSPKEDGRFLTAEESSDVIDDDAAGVQA